jgi:hypothetical protein
LVYQLRLQEYGSTTNSNDTSHTTGYAKKADFKPDYALENLLQAETQ